MRPWSIIWEGGGKQAPTHSMHIRVYASQGFKTLYGSFKVTHLDDHFKGEHSSEDIIKIAQDLENTKSR